MRSPCSVPDGNRSGTGTFIGRDEHSSWSPARAYTLWQTTRNRKRRERTETGRFANDIVSAFRVLTRFLFVCKFFSFLNRFFTKTFQRNRYGDGSPTRSGDSLAPLHPLCHPSRPVRLHSNGSLSISFPSESLFFWGPLASHSLSARVRVLCAFFFWFSFFA